jgi:hypothetical protein
MLISSTLFFSVSAVAPVCSKPSSSELNEKASWLVAKTTSDVETDNETSADNDCQSGDLKSSSASASSESKSETQNKLRQFKRQLIDTSVEEKSAAPAASTLSEPKSAMYLEREARLSAPLKKLIQAPQIYDHSKGGSSEYSDAFTAAAKEGAKNREDLLFVVENGSPAGKIYAAVLLKMIDGPAGTKILNGFKSEKTLVNNKSYTSLEHFTMGEIATDLLSPSPSIVLKAK